MTLQAAPATSPSPPTGDARHRIKEPHPTLQAEVDGQGRGFFRLRPGDLESEEPAGLGDIRRTPGFDG